MFSNSVEEIEAEMQHALDLAWKNDDPKIKAYQDKIFPNGEPTLEKFLEKISQIVQR